MNKKISILGVPMDLGAARRGVDMGPSAFRVAHVGQMLTELGYSVQDRGNLIVQVRESLNELSSKVKFKEEIASVLTKLSDSIYQILKDGQTPVVLGGDHSIAMGTVAGLSRFYAEKKQKVGLLWFDAHGDINTPETTLSGNVHGMPVAHIVGRGDEQLLKISSTRPMVDPSKVVLIGLRDLDPGEKKAIRDLNIKAFTMRDIDEFGLREVMRQSFEVVCNGTAGFHCSFDMDWVDPSVAPGVGTPVRGGATYREAHLAMELVFDSSKMVSMELTEVNPVLDVQNQTASLAVEMILSAFGKRIL